MHLKRLSDWRLLPFAIYSTVGLVVLWQLLLPGFVLTLDMVYARHIKVGDILYGFRPVPHGFLPLGLAFDLLGSLVPLWVLQKVMLFLIFLLGGLSAHRLCPVENKLGKYFSGLFYILNPFVFVKFMTGDILTLLAYAITPFVIRVMIDFLEVANLRRAILVATLLTALAVLNVNMLFLSLFLMTVLLSVRTALAGRTQLQALKWIGVTASLFLGLNAYWIAPSLMRIDEIWLQQISHVDLGIFMPRTWGTYPNILFALATLHGHWRSPEGFSYVTNLIPGWYLLYFFVLFLAVLGFFFTVSRKNNKENLLAWGLPVAAVASFILATGVSTPYFSWLYTFLFDNFFFFRGFRESFKFIALLALGYSILGGMGLSEVADQAFRKRHKTEAKSRFNWRATLGVIVVIAALATPFVYSANMLAGFGGSLNAVDYPTEWYRVNDYLNAQEGDFNVLFLPWHQYMHLSWVGRIVSNPADIFFDRPVITGKNVEIGPIETISTARDQEYVSSLLGRRAQIKDFGKLLSPLNVGYIILAKEVDYLDYAFLYNQSDLGVVVDNSYMAVFQNRHPTARFQVSDFAKVKPEDSQELIPEIEGMPGYVRVSPVEYLIRFDSAGSNQYLVFAEPFDTGWRFNGQPSSLYAGVSNVFNTTGVGEGRVYYSKTGSVFVAYWVSLVTLVSVILILLGESRMIRYGSYNRT